MKLWIKDLYSLQHKHRFKIIVGAGLVAVIAFLLILNLDVDADFLSLLNPGDKAVKDYKYLMDNFGATDTYILLVKDKNAKDIDLQKFTGYLQDIESVERVTTLETKYLLNNPDTKYKTVVLVKPNYKPTELDKSRILSKKMKLAVDRYNLDIGISGSYQVLSESADSIRNDMSKAAIITLLGISFLLIIVLKLPVMVIIATVMTLILALSITFALTWLMFGRLNFLTATLPSVILGLGVDFSLHIIYSFNEKSRRLIDTIHEKDYEKLKEQVIAHVQSKTFRPIFIAAITTAVAFLALCFARSRGLFEMGLIGAIGIISAFLTSIIILPVLLSYIPLGIIVKIKRIENFWSKAISYFDRRGIYLAAITLTAVIIAAVFCFKVGFNTDQNKLISQNIKSLVIQNEILGQLHISPVPIIFISPDKETDIRKSTLIQNQHDMFSFIQNSSTASIFNQNPKDFIGKDGHFLTLAYPSRNPFERRAYERIQSFINKLKEQFPESENIVTGSVFLNHGLNNTVKMDLAHCTIIAIVFIFAAVYISFRSLKNTTLSMLPVMLGTFLTIGLMGLLHIDFNIMTVVVLPLIIGAGIDDGVHIVYSWQRENHDTIRSVSGVASAVVATTLTSVIAFGSLISAGNPGFREIGLVISAGLGFCLIISLVVLPCVLSRIRS